MADGRAVDSREIGPEASQANPTEFVDGLFSERPGQVGRQNFEQAGAEQELE